MAVLNLKQAIASGGLKTTSAPAAQKSTGLTGANGRPMAVPTFSAPKAVNLNQAIASGGLTVNPASPQQQDPNRGVQGAATSSGGGAPAAPDFRDEVMGLFKDWASGSTADTNGLADEITSAEQDAANREYGDIMGALGVQKGEVDTLGNQQRTSIKQEGDIGMNELTGRQTREVTSIDKEREQFKTQDQDQRDQLAQAWRDMSLETQRISRASGRSDTGFAAEKESGLLQNFNRGLSKLAQTSQAALKDFSDAVIETNRYYGEEKNKLALSVQNQLQSVDNWVRQQIQGIQAQENTALSNKLSQIRQAMIKGQQLKVQTAQAIRDKTLELGTWLAQTQAQYKMAVASAAQGNVASAQAGVKAAYEQFKMQKDMLDSGFVKPVDAGNGNYALVAPGGTGQDEWANYGYVPSSAVYSSAQRQASNVAPSNINASSQYNNVLNAIQQQMGLSQTPAAQPQQNGGLVGSIRSYLGI